MVLYFLSGGAVLVTHLLLIQTLHTTADTPTTLQAIKANCTGKSYNQNSPFATNLATLLSSLTNKSSSSNSAAANVTSGNSSDNAYGLFMCQGDLSNSDCNACVSTAAKAITQSCPAARQAIIWYDTCELRYSDFNYFGIPDTAGFSMINLNKNTSSKEPFTVVADLVKSAPLQRPLMFASKALINESLYALAQCTVDLSVHGCSMCLTTILADINSCCIGPQGWRYLAASCWVRYEATPFLHDLNTTTISPSGPLPQASPPGPSPPASPPGPPPAAS